MLITEERKLKQIHTLYTKTDTCWLWQGTVDKEGYGKLSYKKRNFRAHRIMWSIEHQKEIPENLVILHLCDVPSCVNPSHLKCGTQLENMQDKKRKGRCAVGDSNGMRKFPGILSGELNGTAKLSNEQVLEMRKLHREGKTGVFLAKRYNIWPSQVSNIVNRRQWSHI